MPDPRAENCKAFHLDANGKVDGVQLVYVPSPSTQYELIKAELIDEVEAKGNTVAYYLVLDKDGIQTGERVYLCWPFPEITNKQLPGNQNGQHMITNGFDAAAGKIGPLALLVGDAQGNVISDVIGGLGLPNNRHVCYRMVWRERGSVVEPPPPGGGETPPPAVEPSTDLIAAIDRLNATLREAFRLP